MAELSARLILCERTDRWAAVWRGLLDAQQLPFCEVRSLAEASERLFEAPASVIAVACRADRIEPVCHWLRATTRAHAGARAVVLASPDLRVADCVFRAAGAHLVLDDPLQLPRATRWVRRHLASVPRRELPLGVWIEQLLGRLGRSPAPVAELTAWSGDRGRPWFGDIPLEQVKKVGK